MNRLVLPGDDIGPEITVAALKVLDRAKKAASTFRARSSKRLDLYANIRPARSGPGLHKALPNLDCLIGRENTEGFYSDRNMFLGSGNSCRPKMPPCRFTCSAFGPAIEAAQATLDVPATGSPLNTIASSPRRQRQLDACEALILGQFSMASAADGIPPSNRRRVLTSPASAVLRLKQVLLRERLCAHRSSRRVGEPAEGPNTARGKPEPRSIKAYEEKNAFPLETSRLSDVRGARLRRARTDQRPGRLRQ